MDVTQILDDEREISTLCTHGEAGFCYFLGGHNMDSATKIVPYTENGQLAPVIWFAIYKGNRICARVNGAMVEVIKYKEDNDA